VKAVSYFRVSTAAQGRSGLGLDAQRAAIDSISRARGYDIVAEFTEVESGKRNDRPQLAAALHHAKVTGATLLIAKLDRLGRNAAFLLTLRDSGARFVAADMPDATDLTIGVLAVVAQAERDAISRRTKEALAAVRARIASPEGHTSQRSGRAVTRLGNPNGAAALRRSPSNSKAASKALSAKADASAANLSPVVATIRAEGIQSLAGIAARLNDLGMITPRGGRWHASSVSNLLKRLG